MPSAKSHRAHSRKAAQNKIVRTFARTRVTKARENVEGGAVNEETEASVRAAFAALDKAARKGVIHRNQAARKKSRLQRKLNAVAGS
jgi:small subunit ribosomal protein S20